MQKILKHMLFVSLLFSLGSAEDIKSKSSWGVEINPLSLTILGTGSSIKGFSGVVSHFDNEQGEEIALSLVYLKESEAFDYGDNIFTPTKTINTALHYRKFLSNKTKGFYYGGFASYTYLDGELKDDIRLATVEKFGLGGEIGLRLMKTDSDWSLYWGPALRIGGYLGSNNDIFEKDTLGMDIYDKKLFFDVDFMRIGLRF
ncbi:MAG: hypothetical protein KAG56_02835 [Sulfurovaceae bacterium]|nr:hypothetical protein [Sulfurovaceae bacterium]